MFFYSAAHRGLWVRLYGFLPLLLGLDLHLSMGKLQIQRYSLTSPEDSFRG
jgi:hypothetical protein